VKAQPNQQSTFTFFSPREGSQHICDCRNVGLTVDSVVYETQYISHSPRTFFTSDVADLKESDWVVVTLKGTDDGLNSLTNVLPKILRKDGTSRLVVVMNGLVDQKICQIVEATGAPIASISGCAAYICANREANGVVKHTYLGDLKGGVVKATMDIEDEGERLQKFWEGSVGFEMSNILHLRWLKSLWNVPFNGMCTVLNCTTDAIATDSERRMEITAIMDEIIAVANLDLAANGNSKRLQQKDKEIMWHHTDTMGAYSPSTLLDLRRERELELRYIFDEIVKRGEAYGCEIEETKKMVAQLHERHHAGGNNA